MLHKHTQEKARNLSHEAKMNHVNTMANKWKPSTVYKKEADPGSISSIKKRHMSTRKQARLLQQLMIQKRLDEMENTSE